MFTLVQTFTIYVIGSTDVEISERYALYEPSDLIAILKKLITALTQLKTDWIQLITEWLPKLIKLVQNLLNWR